jgi:hypothetical protein
LKGESEEPGLEEEEKLKKFLPVWEMVKGWGKAIKELFPQQSIPQMWNESDPEIQAQNRLFLKLAGGLVIAFACGLCSIVGVAELNNSRFDANAKQPPAATAAATAMPASEFTTTPAPKESRGVQPTVLATRQAAKTVLAPSPTPAKVEAGATATASPSELNLPRKAVYKNNLLMSKPEQVSSLLQKVQLFATTDEAKVREYFGIPPSASLQVPKGDVFSMKATGGWYYPEPSEGYYICKGEWCFPMAFMFAGNGQDYFVYAGADGKVVWEKADFRSNEVFYLDTRNAK